MLTAELKVNGCLIGHLYIVNKTPRDGTFSQEFGDGNVNTYYVEYVRIGEGGRRSEGMVRHDRNDGAEALFLKAMEAVAFKEPETKDVKAGTAAKCKKCGTEIQSKSRHDFVQCKCGAIFVDGGTDYWRCGGDFKQMLVKVKGEWVPYEF